MPPGVRACLGSTLMTIALARPGTRAQRRNAGWVPPWRNDLNVNAISEGVGGVTCAPSLRGAIATKQSRLFPRRQYGLLRGTCHRARVRATRWLAMTISW